MSSPYPYFCAPNFASEDAILFNLKNGFIAWNFVNKQPSYTDFILDRA